MRFLIRRWKARRITRMFMDQFAREHIEELTAEAMQGPSYTAEEIGRMLGVLPESAKKGEA